MKTANPQKANSGFLLAVVLTVFFWLLLVSTRAASTTVKVEPRESDGLLANPGMGWQPFHRFADNDPNLQGLPSASAYFRFDLVDIGSVGLWGEWHMSGTQVVGTDRPVALPSPETLQAVIDVWCSAFPTANKVMLIGSDVGMPQTAKGDFGWRADCLGDMGGFSKTWNHMDNFYLQQLAKTGAEEAWKRAPVAFESCWDMRKWKEAGWDIRFIFDYALRCHASYVNNKSAPIPEGTRPEIERFLRRLGYRLVIRSVEHEARAKVGGTTTVSIRWENAGVAPPYRDYRLAIRLRSGDSKTGPRDHVTDTSIRGWLPGTHRTDSSLQLSAKLAPGRYDVAVGVVDSRERRPAVRLANAGRDAEGWYRVSELEIVP